MGETGSKQGWPKGVTTLSKITVLTVDDHPLLREGIAAVIQGEEDLNLVAEAANGQRQSKPFTYIARMLL